MAEPLKVTCTHHAPAISIPAYLAGYVRKRREDSTKGEGGRAVRCDDGSMSYRLCVDLPAWVTNALGIPPLHFDETVRLDSDGVIRIDAACSDADLRVETEVRRGAGGCDVTTNVWIVPEWRGYAVPHFLVRQTVNYLFSRERKRDEDFARVDS